jgi:adenylate cyclase
MSAQPPQVLIVDDNEMNRDMLARRLERQGCEAITAEDGMQALEILPQHSFDLVLLDIMMPRMTGYEVLDHIKNDPDTRHIPVIMISAVDDLESVVKCVEKGADDYLFKPFNPILLKARINASLEKKRLRDQEQILMRQVNSGSSSGENKTLVRRFFEELAEGRCDRSLITANFSLVDSGKVQLDSQKLDRVFTGLDVEIRELIAEYDKVVAQLFVQPVNTPILVVSQLVEGKIAAQEYYAGQPGWLQERLS